MIDPVGNQDGLGGGGSCEHGQEMTVWNYVLKVEAAVSVEGLEVMGEGKRNKGYILGCFCLSSR